MPLVRWQKKEKSMIYDCKTILGGRECLDVLSMFRKAIRGLGEQNFQRVYDYYVRQRTAMKTNPDLNEEKISQGAKAMVNNPASLFLVEQLVFLEMH